MERKVTGIDRNVTKFKENIKTGKMLNNRKVTKRRKCF